MGRRYEYSGDEVAAAFGAAGLGAPTQRLLGLDSSGGDIYGRGLAARWWSAHRRGRSESKAAARRELAEDIQAGLETTRIGMHRVEKIIDVRRPDKRRGLQLEVLIQYAGVQYFSRAPWPPEWVSVSVLTADLASEARRMEGERWEATRFRERPEGSRKCARLQREDGMRTADEAV